MFNFSIEGGMLDRYATFKDALRSSVYGCGRQFGHIAADLDLSPSRLSRMLADNPDDKLNFPIDLLERIIVATGDESPVLWLVERFLVDKDIAQQQAIAHLSQLLPKIDSLLKAATK